MTLPRPLTVQLPLLAGLLLASVIAGGCQATAPALAGRTFLSVSITENGAPKILVAGTRIRLDFKDGAVSANIGCNQMGGEFHFDGGRLVVGQMSSTAMGCNALLAGQDAWLMQLLGSRPGVTLVGDDLTIDGGSVVVHLADRRVADPDKPLVGPTWTVDSIITGEVVSSVAGGSIATLVFHADGTLDVNDGCNTGAARWVTVASGISVTELTLTKKACPVAADLSAAVDGTLRGGAIAATIQANQLMLRAGANGIGLTAR
jgi:heat shock protein HslJ